VRGRDTGGCQWVGAKDHTISVHGFTSRFRRVAHISRGGGHRSGINRYGFCLEVDRMMECPGAARERTGGASSLSAEGGWEVVNRATGLNNGPSRNQKRMWPSNNTSTRFSKAIRPDRLKDRADPWGQVRLIACRRFTKPWVRLLDGVWLPASEFILADATNGVFISVHAGQWPGSRGRFRRLKLGRSEYRTNSSTCASWRLKTLLTIV
jgi:hypothetical protein